MEGTIQYNRKEKYSNDPLVPLVDRWCGGGASGRGRRGCGGGRGSRCHRKACGTHQPTRPDNYAAATNLVNLPCGFESGVHFCSLSLSLSTSFSFSFLLLFRLVFFILHARNSSAVITPPLELFSLEFSRLLPFFFVVVENS